MPLQLALAVELDRLGISQLLHMVSRLGFCMSYDEVVRYKQSVLQFLPGCVDEKLPDHDQRPFMQYVADNLDHNVRMLDGQGTFHGMGIISVSTFTKGTFGSGCHRVSQTSKRLTATDVTKGRSVQVMHFCPDDGQGLESVRMHSFESLNKPDFKPPSLLKLNVLWQSAELLMPYTLPRPSWCGYMQTVCQGEHLGVSGVEMLSVIDLSPSDDDCIYSTLSFVIQQAKMYGVITPCLTFDQPLYIKALDISKKMAWTS